MAPGHSIYEPKFEYVGPDDGGGWGCGSNNYKCGCTTTANGLLKMVGRGTTGSATGLAFSCGFKLNPNANQCYLRVYLEYYHAPNHIECKCDGNYEFTDCNIANGEREISQRFHLKSTNELRYCY